MTDRAVALDLDAIEAVANAATPAPWEAYYTVHGDPYVAQQGRPKFGVVVSTAPDDYGRADAEFIAASREAVPALIAEVRRLRADLRRG